MVYTSSWRTPPEVWPQDRRVLFVFRLCFCSNRIHFKKRIQRRANQHSSLADATAPAPTSKRIGPSANQSSEPLANATAPAPLRSGSAISQSALDFNRRSDLDSTQFAHLDSTQFVPLADPTCFRLRSKRIGRQLADPIHIADPTHQLELSCRRRRFAHSFSLLWCRLYAVPIFFCFCGSNSWIRFTLS